MTVLAAILSAWLGVGAVLFLFVILSARRSDGAAGIALGACFLFLWPCLLGMMLAAAALDRIDRRREGERA